MRKTVALMAAGALALLLGACNTQNAGTSTGKSTVTVSVAFPQRSSSGSGLAPQGVPWSAEEADVKVYDGQGALVQTVTLTRANPTAALLLENGTYAFEVSVWNVTWENNQPQRWKEVAWGRETHTITQDTWLLLKPKAILGEAWLSYSGNGVIAPGEELNLRLWVREPGGFFEERFPLEDYTVSYTIGTCTQPNCSDFTPSTAATIVAQSKTGVRIKAGQVQQNTTLYVKAEVSGLGSNHQPITLTRFSQPIQIRVSGSSVGIALDFNAPWIIPNAPSAPVSVGQPVTFSGFAGDGETGLTNLVVYVNSQEVPVTLTPTLPANSTNFAFTFTPSVRGRYDIDIVAFDGAGNSYRYYTYVEAQ